MSTLKKNAVPFLPVIWFFVLIFLQWPSSYLIQRFSLTLGLLPYEWIFVAAIPIWLGIKFQKNGSKLFPFQKPKKKIVLYTFLMTFALMVIIDTLIFWSEKILPPPPEIKEMLRKLMTVQSTPDAIWRWFLICLTPAFCEEIFFRGYFQNTLRKNWGKTTALVLTSVAFTLIHSIPWYWHLYLILGLFLTWLSLEGGTLWLPILVHLINNSWTFLNHIFGEEKTAQKGTSTDFLIFAIALFVFGVSALNFRRECSYSAKSPPSRRR